MISILRLIVAALSATLLSPVAAQQSTPPAKQPSVEDFFRHPQYLGVELSPNGQFIAAIVPHRDRRNVAVLDLKGRSATLVTSLTNADVRSVTWVNNNRLVFSLIDLQRPAGEQRGSGLFAVDRDGKNGRELSPILPYSSVADVWQRRYSSLLRTIRPTDGSEVDDILVVSNDRNLRYSDVYRMDTRTGRKTLLTFESPGNVVEWTLDRNGVPRAALVDEDNGEVSVHFRASEKEPWKQLSRYHIYRDGATATLQPIAFDYDGLLLVRAFSPAGKLGIFAYDTANNRLGEQLVAHKDFDVFGLTADSGLIFDAAKKKLVGITFEAERREYVWFDAQWAGWQKMVDQTLPGAVNILVKPVSSPYLLVSSYSDRNPMQWFLFDPVKLTMERVVASMPWIEPSLTTEQSFIRYPARDGLDIPAYLTLPKGVPAKALPLIVDVHGGPYVRGHIWGYNPEAQFFASRGYAVLQPEFRGSRGYGWKHYQSGWKQWGLAMQDDLNDGVEHLVKQGIVDPSRVCIYGGSYGGYAVMMGLARDPDIWRCGVNIVGVTDLELLITQTWSDTNYEWRGATQAFYDASIGDPKADRERFEKTSPMRQAARIKRPVLLAYGGLDRRVPIEHGERMRSALRSAGVPHEYVVYETEGHGFLLEKNRFDFYSRVEKFLAEQLK
jgi:dipeptidyl aminopeptidase/acylaminoacyl peptidase